MLTDDELQAIADKYVRTELSEWKLWDIRPNLMFTIPNPAGAYFKPRIYNWVPELDDNARKDLTEPLAQGFFIHRETGDTRIISEGDIGGAHWSIDWGNVPNPWETEVKPEHIRYVLTGAIHPNSYDPSSGALRLTPDEIEIIAYEYVQSVLPGCVAIGV